MIEPVKNRTIQVHVQPLAQFIHLVKSDFKNLPEYHQYKKNTIYQQRNHYLSVFLQHHISEADILRNEFGKPYLAHLEKIAFNHSHSQQHYALIMSQNMANIGVDVEDLDRKVRFETLAKHAFHPQEYQTWQDVEFDSEYWFKVWTTKEAVLKASGLGIRLSLNTLNTQVHPFDHGGICTHPLIGVFAYQNYRLPNCMLTIAWRSEHSCKGFAFPQIKMIQH
ncbi:4'-phosphopantetheinyl transferase family protein [Acinetobacter piscicola]|uniref:4'-phosphopantetheinyl transferase family protein n=1 Tax=Acinetobacter piscicola TaxID=2006115 RepID=UPI001021AEE8|nr:4'-phosphopantetheinyl transferase superfamily protein [Acinetobacter piscicola]RYL25895.1 4'-phosphopantetheinyl transferase superfamily protein [Acinetobacter piscicola]